MGHVGPFGAIFGNFGPIVLVILGHFRGTWGICLSVDFGSFWRNINFGGISGNFG